MKKSLILIIGMLIGIGLTVGWQLRISTPESFETNGTIESSYDAFIESLIKSGDLFSLMNIIHLIEKKHRLTYTYLELDWIN